MLFGKAAVPWSPWQLHQYCIWSI